MKFCTKCEEDYGNWYNFCPECGSYLIKRKEAKCPDCGEVIFSVYCINCGEWVGEELLKELKYKQRHKVDCKKVSS